MYSTGIKKFDEILNGGFPDKSLVMVIGGPETGKEVLTYQFIQEGLKNGESAFYIFGEKRDDILLEEFRSYNLNVEPYLGKNLVFYDADSMSSKEGFVNVNIKELYTISHAIRDFLGQHADQKVRGVIGIASQAMIIHEFMDFYQFINDLRKLFIQYGCCVMLPVELGMHDQKTIVSLEHLCDGIIELSTGEISYIAKIKKMRGKQITLQGYPYWISNKGFEFLD